MTTNLVVADASRTDKTICLAVSPALKSFGIPGRPRLFEVKQQLKTLNALRKKRNHRGEFRAKSVFLPDLQKDTSLQIDTLVVPPRMAEYIRISTEIYNTYLSFFAPEDIHVYSIDEVFIDVTGYLHQYSNVFSLVETVLESVYTKTGITATAGIGTNLYLAKVAMDIVAKHIEADENKPRIAYLDELSYRKLLWEHRPLTDFWRVGKGYARKLEANRLYTMGDIALQSVQNEHLLFKLFGKNAELLIDHAWGVEPCTIQDIKQYKPQAKSLGSGQVLHRPYTTEEAKTVLFEMADALSLDLVEKQLVCEMITLTIGYDIDNLTNPLLRAKYKGNIKTDGYGREIPEHSHSTYHLEAPTSSSKAITDAFRILFERIVKPDLLIRRLQLSLHHLSSSTSISPPRLQQFSLFDDIESIDIEQQEREKKEKREKKMQEALLKIKEKYGKNSVVKASSLKDEATAKDRNQQIGGHKA